MQPKNPPRLQHYLPRFYLERFCDPVLFKQKNRKVLWAYEKGRPIRRANPSTEARRHDFYTLKRNGKKSFEVEHWLGRIESNAATLINKLEAIGYLPNAEERKHLALFVATMFTRTPAGYRLLSTRSAPAARRLINQTAQDPQEFRKLVAETFGTDQLEFDLEEERRKILAGRLEELSKTAEMRLLRITEIAQMSADILLPLDWQFIYADGAFFITSDCPVVSALWKPELNIAHFRMGFNAPGVDIHFPISRNICLRMKKGIEPGPCTIRERGVRYINKATIICAHRRIYAADNSEKLRLLFDKRGNEVTIEQFQPMWQGKPL